jgi:outer membrane protein OmpA-like peptidoglycan-associated protein/endonuclease YncB( thermonuclease family)
MTPPASSRDASYRRGTIMGLTAAEAFMLICFILLLLLGLWRQSSEERLAKAQEAEAFHDAFSAEERIAALTYKPRLAELGDDLVKLGNLSRLVEEADGAQQVEDAIRLFQEVKGTPPEEVAERARLLDDATLKQLARAAVKLPDETKRKLVDLAELESFPEIVAAVHAAPEETLEVRAQREELAAYRKTDMTPDDVSRMRSKVSDLNRINDSALETGADIAAAIREQAGDVIRGMGGRILDNGNVTFPEGVLFDSGRADLKPEFDAVLSRFCRPWFEILQGFDGSLNNIQIEGHASSEWTRESSTSAAFANNLDLSQKRAANVFKTCLGYAGDDETAHWARSRLAAIGYSSSRPVLGGDGVEDKAASRRVVFAIDTKTAQEALSEAIDAGFGGASGTQEPGIPADPASPAEATRKPQIDALPGEAFYRERGYSPLTGRVSRVVDGDTLLVGETKVRLEGLHAPELSDPFGSNALNRMRSIAMDREASCWLSGASTYDRKVGVCFIEDRDIAGALIATGLGRDCPGFSKGRYAGLEADAPILVTGALPSYCQPR